MSKRRDHLLRLHCHHEGCKETSFYTYPTLREYNDAVKRGRGSSWMCIRHNDGRLLTPGRLTQSITLVNGKSEIYPDLDDLFWTGGRGFAYGASWKAFARDFPPGTQIIETVEVVLPAETTASDADTDPTPYCAGCGAMKRSHCACGPIAENE